MAPREIERLAGLTPNLLSCLVLFDVLEPVDDRYRLSRPRGGARGRAPPEARRRAPRTCSTRRSRCAGAAAIWPRRGSSRVRRARWCARFGGQLAELSGQLTMRLGPTGRAASTICWSRRRSAEEARRSRRRPRASTRRPCAPMPTIRCCPSISATSSTAQGRAAEAKIAWQIAVARDPAFAEAWYNLALAAEDEEQTDLAVAEYRRAVQAQPDYADAHFNLALLLTEPRPLRTRRLPPGSASRARTARPSRRRRRRRRSRCAACSIKRGEAKAG